MSLIYCCTYRDGQHSNIFSKVILKSFLFAERDTKLGYLPFFHLNKGAGFSNVHLLKVFSAIIDKIFHDKIRYTGQLKDHKAGSRNPLRCSKPMTFLHVIHDNRVYLGQGVKDLSFDRTFQCIDLANIKYEAYCDDFGPMNMSSTIEFIQLLDSKIGRASCRERVCQYV